MVTTRGQEAAASGTSVQSAKPHSKAGGRKSQPKKKGVSKKSPYTQGFTGQVRALVKRQFTQKMQDKFQLYTSMCLSTALALVIGGAFFNLPPTSAGAFTRGG